MLLRYGKSLSLCGAESNETTLFKSALFFCLFVAPGGKCSSGGRVGRDGVGTSAEEDWGSLIRWFFHRSCADTVLRRHISLRQWVAQASLKCVLWGKLNIWVLFYFYFYINFLLGAHNTPSLWAGTNGGCVFAYMLRLPNVEHRADEPVTAQQGENIK